MFTTGHFLWLGVCVIVVAVSLYMLNKKRPPLKNVFTIACVVCVLSEVIKVFSVIEIVPSADGTMWYPYIELQHLPFHLCSIQIITIFIIRFSQNEKMKERLLAFLYPLGIVGGILAILMPTIFATQVDPARAFLYPLSYQYFLYHSMLIVVGVYIVMSNEIDFRTNNYFESVALLLLMGFISLYLNSMFAEPVYINGVLQSVEYTTNFFFTYKFPIDLGITEKWQWMLYIGVIALLVFVVLWLMYWPFIKRTKKKDALAAADGASGDVRDTADVQ